LTTAEPTVVCVSETLKVLPLGGPLTVAWGLPLPESAMLTAPLKGPTTLTM
jgi:hypothetical protein